MMKLARTRLVWSVALFALICAPVIAEDMITNGADLWPTVEGGSLTSFADDPIPADFFCPGSKPFDGEIRMNGKPLVTEPAGVLGKTDTIVRRLDDATFDENGVATTRLQMMALSLVGTEPIDVGCSTQFEVYSTLAGEQPLTEMRIFREEEWGGRYASPLSLNVRLVFTPVGGGEAIQVRRAIDLGPSPDSYWTTTDRVGVNALGQPVQVDTDGDGSADSSLPGPSNFVVGMSMTEEAAISAQPRWCKSTCTHCKPEDDIPPPQWNQPNDYCDPWHLHETSCWKPCGAIEIDASEL